MLSDIVLPNNNEEEFIELASKLDIRKLYFLYDSNEYDEEKIKKELEAVGNREVNIEIGFLANQKNLSHAAKKSNFVAVKSSEKDRFFIENKKIKLIYGFEDISRKDSLHQRTSGLNHVLCELAKKNNVAIGFSYSSLFNKSDIDKSLLIGRMMQNINLCKKYKVKTVIGSFSSNPYHLRLPHDVSSLFGLLGMDSKTIKDSVSFDF